MHPKRKEHIIKKLKLMYVIIKFKKMIRLITEIKQRKKNSNAICDLPNSLSNAIKIVVKQRKCDVHPMNKWFRTTLGFYPNMIGILRHFPDRFKDMFRMNVQQFDYTLEIIQHDLIKQTAKGFPPDMRLYIFLR